MKANTMQCYNAILIYDYTGENILFCKRMKTPYKDKWNFVGGKIEDNEEGFCAAYRELYEETGIDKMEIELSRLMDITYYAQNFFLEIYVGRLKTSEVKLVEEKNPLAWISTKENFFDVERFAGDGNIGHIVQIAKSGIGINKSSYRKRFSEDWKEIYEKGKAAAKRSTKKHDYTGEYFESIKAVVRIIESSEMDEKDIRKIKNNIAEDIYNIHSEYTDMLEGKLEEDFDLYYKKHYTLIQNVYNHYKESIKQMEYAIHLIENYDDEINRHNVVELKKRICRDIKEVCIPTTYYYSKDQCSTGEVCCLEFERELYMNKYQKFIEEIREAYWKEHETEKQKYEIRLKEIQLECEEIDAKIEQQEQRIVEIKEAVLQEIPMVTYLTELEIKKDELEKQRAELDLFAVSQKKQLKEQLADIELQIKATTEFVLEQKEAVEKAVADCVAEVEKERKSLEKQKMNLVNERKHIRDELTKDRHKYV